MKLRLVVLTPGKTEGKVIPITLSQFVIGRDPQCHLRPASAVISKRHCALLVREGNVYVRDFDSTNGTFINDQAIKGEVQLNHNDRLKIGPLLFNVLIEETAAAPRPTPAPLPQPAPASLSDDDSAAAMLLEGGEETARGSAASPEVPEGSTVMDLPAPPLAPVPPPIEKKVPEQAKDKKEKDTTGSTAAAAKAILERYQRRPRGTPGKK
jgi:predicted component of type VI protein secretion system